MYKRQVEHVLEEDCSRRSIGATQPDMQAIPGLTAVRERDAAADLGCTGVVPESEGYCLLRADFDPFRGVRALQRSRNVEATEVQWVWDCDRWICATVSASVRLSIFNAH